MPLLNLDKDTYDGKLRGEIFGKFRTAVIPPFIRLYPLLFVDKLTWSDIPNYERYNEIAINRN